jgi:hypothetical protein
MRLGRDQLVCRRRHARATAVTISAPLEQYKRHRPHGSLSRIEAAISLLWFLWWF